MFLDTEQRLLAIAGGVDGIAKVAEELLDGLQEIDFVIDEVLAEVLGGFCHCSRAFFSANGRRKPFRAWRDDLCHP